MTTGNKTALLDLAKKSRPLFFQIHTFRPPERRLLARWLESVREPFLEAPLQDAMRHLNSTGTDLHIGWELYYGRAGDEDDPATSALPDFDYTSENWQELLRMFSRGELVVLGNEGWIEGTGRYERVFGADILVDLIGTEWRRATFASVRVNRGLFGRAAPSGFQHAFVEKAKRSAIEMNARLGYIGTSGVGYTVDPIPDDVFKLPTWYWGTFVSEQHIKVLGGRARVLSEAPCAVMEDLSRDGHELVYLQLTESVEDVPAEAERALRRFLDPLIKGFPHRPRAPW